MNREFDPDTAPYGWCNKHHRPRTFELDTETIVCNYCDFDVEPVEPCNGCLMRWVARCLNPQKLCPACLDPNYWDNY